MVGSQLLVTARTTVAAFFLALAFAACTSPKAQEQSSASAAPVPQRVVALVPSLVEDLYAIGAGPQVVAVASFSDNVKEARGLPRVADFSNVDSEKIVALHADLVLGIPEQERLVEPLIRAGVKVVLIPNDTYDEIFSSLTQVGDLTGHQREAAAEIASLKEATTLLQMRTASFTRHPSAFVVLGTAPIWTVGDTSYIGTLIHMAGGRNAASDLKIAYGQYSAEALLHDDPDVIIDDPMVHLQSSLDREPWRSLHAVQEHQVYTIAPAEILMRPGPNYNKGL
ncbi:MAG TPA: helical backbone metal receptor, partial [Candidatus Acidoferrales bacterium]|nr:helical backbone metal receptor [Candidatus Acidoferrales bacterium]